VFFSKAVKVTGFAMIEVKESLKHLEDKFDLKYCAIYVIPGKEKMVDYYFENVPLPVFSMEYFKSHHFRESML
jgi:hypothetical protein